MGRSSASADRAWRRWQLDGELNGHSWSQTVGLASDMQDLADREIAEREFSGAVVVSPDIPRRSWLGRLFGDRA